MSNVIDLISRRSGKDRGLKISTGNTVRSNKVKNQTLKWSTIVERLLTAKVTEETIAAYLKMPREDQDKIKDVGYFVPAHYDGEVRKGKNLGPKELGTLDFDHAGPDFAGKIRTLYDGLDYVLYTTHKHTREKPRFRLVFLFSRPVNDEEYQAIMRQIAARGDINECDDTTFQPSRVMHFASHAIDGEFIKFHCEGAALDVDAVLATYADWKNIAQWPFSDRVLAPLRASGTKAQDPREKTGAIGAFCNVYDIFTAMDAFLPGAYLPTSPPNRFTYSKGSTSNGAIVYDDGQFLYSHHESDPCFDQNVNAFDLVRLHLYENLDVRQVVTGTELKSYKAMLKLALSDVTVRTWMHAERAQLADDFKDFEDDGLGEVAPATPATAAEPLSRFEAIKAWRLAVFEDGSPDRNSLRNVEKILHHDPLLTGCVGLNIFTAEMMQLRALPGLKRKIPPRGLLWPDIAEVTLKSYIEKTIGVSFPTTLIVEACQTTAWKNIFDPVRDWLDALVWDGTPRLGSFLHDIIGAEKNAYHAAVFSKWMAAGVARTYHPGHKFDFILVLEDVEGVGKSRLLEVLANGWFCGDFTFGLSSKEVVEKAKGALVIEIAELVARSNTEVEHIKAMLSRGTETVRLAYERNAASFARRWIMAGTTNDATYLKSETGNRRFWCVRGDGRKIDVEAVRAVVPQLWAEAKDLWTYAEPLYLEDATVAAYATEQQTARVEVDEWTGKITTWLNGEDEIKKEDFVPEDKKPVARERTCALEVWVQCLKGTPDRFNQTHARRIGNIIRKIPGWEPKPCVRIGGEYGTTRGFQRTAESALGS